MIVRILFGLYRSVLSPFLHALAGPGAGCRFEPTCSVYAKEALEKRGYLRGSMLALQRILRCNPWGKGGWDPVP